MSKGYVNGVLVVLVGRFYFVPYPFWRHAVGVP